MNKIKLPKAIRVRVVKEKGGVLFAELPEYSIFTEADTFSSLIFNVNDLVISFFDVPKNLREKVWYSPPEKLINSFYKQMSKSTAAGIKIKKPVVNMNAVSFSVLTSSSNDYFSFK